jgi:hypothetical protein
MIPNARNGRSRVRPLSAAIVLMALISATVTGCSSNLDDAHFVPPSVPVPTATVTAEEQALVDAAWASFEKLNAIYVKAGQTGVYDWNADVTKRPMYQFASGRYGAALERDLDLMHEQGLVRTGEPKVSLRRIVSISETSIMIEACVDDSGTDTINKTTRKSVAAPNQNQRYPVTLRAGLYPDGRWRWVESHAERAASC